MSLLLLPLGAVVAGAISFSSPCCLPLVPSYLSYVSALPVSELGRPEARALALRERAQVVVRSRARAFASKWHQLYPVAVDCLEDDFEHLTTYRRFPAGRIRHSNFISSAPSARPVAGRR